MTYEVDSALGRCLYRGDDLELACDIYEHEIDAHLQLLPDFVPAAERPHGPGWDRAPQRRAATT
jgi:hypothetical protein